MTAAAYFLPEMTVAEYHHAEGPPRLSQSLAKDLVERSPWHAKREMDRRAPRHEDDTGEDDDKAAKRKEAMDRGTIVHALLLGTPTPYVVIADPLTREPYDSFRTKAAKEQKAACAAAGKIAVIKHKVEPILRLADRIRDALYNEHSINLNGESELAVHWTERASDGAVVHCRGMLDHWREDTCTIYDVKVWQSGNPRVLVRKLHEMGVDIQAEAYTRAVEAVHPELAGRIKFVTLVCEASSGLVTPVTFGGGMRQVGRSRWRRAIDTWARCVRLGDWPGYTRGPITLDAPEWMLAAELTAAHEGNELAQYVGRAPVAALAGYEGGDDNEGQEEEDDDGES